jgi:hypothetical protein
VTPTVPLICLNAEENSSTINKITILKRFENLDNGF